MKIIQMKKVLRRTLLVLLIAALVLLIFVSLREPSLSRTWDEDVSILAGVELSNDEAVTFTQIRDWRYAISSISSKKYFDASFDPGDIVAIVDVRATARRFRADSAHFSCL